MNEHCVFELFGMTYLLRSNKKEEIEFYAVSIVFELNSPKFKRTFRVWKYHSVVTSFGTSFSLCITCTKFFDVCRRMANTHSVRSPNATRTACSSSVRYLFGFNTVAYVEQNCGHTLTSFQRINNVLVTYH